MNISASIRSPLLERDSWPVSGPVYAMPHAAEQRRADRTLWVKIFDRLNAPEKDDGAPVAPIYY